MLEAVSNYVILKKLEEPNNSKQSSMYDTAWYEIVSAGTDVSKVHVGDFVALADNPKLLYMEKYDHYYITEDKIVIRRKDES